MSGVVCPIWFHIIVSNNISFSLFENMHIYSFQMRLIDSKRQPLPQDPLLMRDAHDHSEEIMKQITDVGHHAVATIIRGLAIEPTKAPDASFVDDMALFMEGPVVKNIQRGRDNGLPSYNEAREWFGMDRAESYLDLAAGNEAVAMILEGLYGKGNIDDVDAYVGAMMESPKSKHFEIGPLNEASLRDQFERMRNGDRLYYRQRLSHEEIRQIPTLSEVIINAWGNDEMTYFPADLFATVGVIENQGNGARTDGRGGVVDLFDGDLTIQWKTENEYIVFTIKSLEEFSGGYIGLGWNSLVMMDAEIWFCESRADQVKFSSEACDADGVKSDPGPFTCCVAPGERHVRPVCSSKSYLTVLDSCSSDQGSHVTVRAQLCSPDNDNNDCFSHDGNIDFIAAYNPTNVNAAHGFSRRTSGGTNLALGTAATCSDDSAQAGLFALHGATLLFAWLVLAPIAIYIVRYQKDKPWRLRVHITLVGIVGGMMLSVVTAAVVSVEGTSFGTVDAEGAKASTHKKFGLSITFFVVFMIITGE